MLENGLIGVIWISKKWYNATKINQLKFAKAISED